MVSAPLDLELAAIGDEPRPLAEWLTTFPLLAVVLDPYTHESAWILDTSRRILLTYREADCRHCWIVTSGADDARRFLGPYADDILTFADPDGRVARGFGLETLPAFCFVKQDGSVAAAAEGWDPEDWRTVADSVTDLTFWNRPVIPDQGDPVSYSGTPLS